jgi:glycosyltransferase involved in cell wall biosynthesis
MKITFIFPCTGNIPIGGLKIIFEYANRLVKIGNIVNIIYPITDIRYDSVYWRMKAYRWYLKHKINKTYLPTDWFKLDERVNNILVPYISDKYIPDADFVVATAWNTAEPTMNLSKPKGSKYYFIQNFEVWAGKKDEILRTFRMPLKKIVISRWLQKLVNSQNEDAFYIPNGFDFDSFNLEIKPENRDKHQIMMLYHKLSCKGSDIGINSVKKIKEKIPDINFTLFSAYNPPDNLPNWITFIHKPQQSELRKLYNKTSIFLSPSFLEGFPLPPAEAMMSGCALVASDIGGHREYCIHNQTALIYPPRDKRSLIDCVLKLIQNDDLRFNLSYQGYSFIKQFTWERASQSLVTLFQEEFNRKS